MYGLPMTKWTLMALSLTLLGCKDKAKDSPPSEGGKKVASAPAASADKAVADLAAKPRVTVTLDDLGLQLQVPEGTHAISQEEAYKNRMAHVETGEGGFMVNVDAVDEFSAASFEKAAEVYKDDKLIEWIKKDQSKDGWVLVKLIDSKLHGGPNFEVNVRVMAAGKAWDCGVVQKERTYAELAVAACLTLTAKK
jgi:hypothetical protein